MRRWLNSKRIPYLPIGWMVNRYVEWVIGERFDVIAPITTLRQARCPVLIVHGRQDMTVPLDDARRLLHSRGLADAILIELEGTHEAFVDLELANRELLSFLDGACQHNRRPEDSSILPMSV